MKGHAAEEALVCFCLFSSFIDLGVDVINDFRPPLNKQLFPVHRPTGLQLVD